MATAKFEGSFSIGPTNISETTFPAGSKQTGISLTPPNKPSNVDSGLATRNINSPGAFVTLSGVGAGDDVSQCDTFYIKATTPMVLRVTYKQVGAADLVSVIPFFGTTLTEAPPDQYIMLVEIKGSGRVEYAASGSQ